MQVNIRMASETDIPVMLQIYAPYVLQTTVSFEYEVPSKDEFRQRLKRRAEFAWLVCEIDGDIVGYTYAFRYGERAAYDWSAEASIYIAQNQHNRRIGTALYGCLLEVLMLQGYHNLYARISYPNENSTCFHEAQGFTFVGRCDKAGYKLGKWIDLVTYEKRLLPCDGPPQKAKSIRELDEQTLCQIFMRHAQKVR